MLTSMDQKDIVPPTPDSFSRKDPGAKGFDQRKDKQENTQAMNQIFGYSQYKPDPSPQDTRQGRPQAPRTDRYGAQQLQDRDRRPDPYGDEMYQQRSSPRADRPRDRERRQEMYDSSTNGQRSDPRTNREEDWTRRPDAYDDKMTQQMSSPRAEDRDRRFESYGDYNYEQRSSPRALRPEDRERRHEGYNDYQYEQNSSQRQVKDWDRDRRPDGYDDYKYEQNLSPRAIPAGHHRGGRPDLGFYLEDPKNVPYPQEPMWRKHNEYTEPPKIGFDPYKDPEPAKFDPYKDPEPAKSNPGWYLLIRFHKDGESQVKKALALRHKHIEDDGGRIVGIARSHGILVHEGGDPWRSFGEHWDNHYADRNRIHYCVLVICYPSLSRAIQWFDRDGCFKQKDFPTPYAADCIAIPQHKPTDTDPIIACDCSLEPPHEDASYVHLKPMFQSEIRQGMKRTLVLSEYAKITHSEFFRDKFSIPTEDLMKNKYKALPYVVKSFSAAVDNPRVRVARHLRGSWIKLNSIVTLSLFDSLRDTITYFRDPEYLKAKDCQDRVSAPTTIILDLEDPLK